MSLLLLAALVAQQPDTVRLPEVITTASRIGAAAGAGFMAHTVISREELAERGSAQLLDVLRDVPGLTVVQAGSRGTQASIFLRGGESDFVKVLVDGVAINSPGGWFNLANISTGNIERIEIVRGPGSVLHGADAMAGVIQVFTRQGRGPVHPELLLEVGGEGTQRAAGSVAGSGGAGALALELSSLRTDGYHRFNSRYRHEEVSGRIAPVALGRWRAVATFRAGSSRAGFPTDGNGVPSDSNQYTTEDRRIAGLDLMHHVTGSLSLQATVSLSRTEEGYRNAMDAPGDTVGYGFIARSDSRAIRSGVDVRLNGIQVGRISATTGLVYEDERQRSQGTASSNFGLGIDRESNAFRSARSTRAAYTEIGLELPATIAVGAAGRLDDNSAFGTQASWRVGVTVGRLGGLVIHGQVGRAFKAPTFSELYANSPFEVGNPGVRPETATSWEAGVRHHLLDDRVRLSASGFGQRFENLIQYASASPGAPTYANVGIATSRGLEAEVEMVIAPALSISASGTRLWTRVRDNGGSTSAGLALGLPLIRRPGTTGSAAVHWAPSRSTTMRLGVHYLGEREDLDYREFPAARVGLAARTLMDLAVQAALPGLPAGLGLTVRVENLLGTMWQQALGFPGQGRLLHLGIRSGS